MKISKDKLKQIVREELESLNALSERKVKGKAVGNFLKKGRAGRTLTMQGKKYTDLGKGKWKGSQTRSWIGFNYLQWHLLLVMKWSHLMNKKISEKQKQVLYC